MRHSQLAFILAALTGATLVWAAPPASGQLPSGGQVVSGAATLAPSGSGLTVTQTTDKGIINWQSFSIGSGAQVVFIQPGSQSATLNRVQGSEPSAIYGQLSANGQIYLINPNGIVVGPSGQINANGLTLSTADIADGDFLAGLNSFAPVEGGRISIDGGVTTGAGGLLLQSAEVAGDGRISSSGGDVIVNTSSSLTISGSLASPVTMPTIEMFATPVTISTVGTSATPVTISTVGTSAIPVTTLTVGTIATPGTMPTGTMPTVVTTSGVKETSKYFLSGELSPTLAALSPTPGLVEPGALGQGLARDGAVTVRLDLVSIQTD